MTHLPTLIHDLAVILIVAGFVTFLFQWIKQPVVLGYIIAGIIIGPYTPPHILIKDTPNIKTLAELGVIFLMFTLGLEFSFKKLAKVGVSAVFTAIFEVLFMLGLGFFAGRLLGWTFTESIFLGAMLSISSTTIIIKALEELGLKSRGFTSLIFGILIVEDLAAILILVSLASLAASGGFSMLSFAVSSAKLVLVVSSWILAGYFIVPRLIRQVWKFRSDEMLTVFSMGLCLLLVVLASHFNYSPALGAFIMGSILAESAESHRIDELMKPLRDVFAAIFFVSVGMLMDPYAIWEHKESVLLISMITIVGKILVTTLGALVSGQTLKTSLTVGFSLAQIGEFSFLIATLGLSLGVMREFLYPVVVAVSLLTTFTTPYLIRFSSKASGAIEKHLPLKVKGFLDRYHSLVWSFSLQNEASSSTSSKAWLWLQSTLKSFFSLFKDSGHDELYTRFAPWDAHLVRILIHVDSSFGGKTLAEVELRKKYGVNVVAIQRGTGTIVAPKPEQQMFPKDELLVLGTDEQIESVRPLLEGAAPHIASMRSVSLAEYELKGILISPHSPLAGKTIRNAGLREEYGAMVVGVEKEGKKVMNPDSEEIISPNEILWIVGESSKLEKI